MKYYQMKDQDPSFLVWRSLEQCMIDNGCVKNEIMTHEHDDIEAPKFFDIDIYSDKEIEGFLKRKLTDNKIDEVRSFLEVNGKDYKEGMTQFLNYTCTDPDTDQYLKVLSGNSFAVIDRDQFHTISLEDYTMEELEEYVSSYYDGGIEQVKKEYGKDWRQIVAEIIAESN